MLKGLGNLGSILKTAQEMGSKMQAMNEQLKTQQVKGASGGGMIEVHANGLGEILQVKIDEQLVAKGEREMIEDLLPAALNQALQSARKLQAESMQGMTSDFNLPGLSDTVAQITGNQPPQD